MAEVQFESEEPLWSSAGTGGTPLVAEPTMVRLLKRWGIASSTKQANLILIGVAVVSSALAVYIFWRTISPAAPADFTPSDPTMMEEGNMMLPPSPSQP